MQDIHSIVKYETVVSPAAFGSGGDLLAYLVLVWLLVLKNKTAYFRTHQPVSGFSNSLWNHKDRTLQFRWFCVLFVTHLSVFNVANLYNPCIFCCTLSVSNAQLTM